MAAIADTTYGRLRVGLCILLLFIVILPSAGRLISNAEATAESRTNPPGVVSVVAVGRIVPVDGVLTIAAASLLTTPAIVTRLHARQGDWVEQNGLLATLSGNEEMAAALAASERKIDVANARLAALSAGGKQDDIRALMAEVASEAANVAQLESDTRRAHELHEQRMLSAAAMEGQQARLAIATRKLEVSRARLSGLSSVRPADVAVAEAELLAAEADAEEARARLERTLVRAPRGGRVLAVYSYPGQSVAEKGLLAFGATDEMYVEAEVAEEDLGRTHIGQPARITGAAFSGALAGTVQEIGYLVGTREVFANDPTAFADSRVVPVRIRVAEPARVERFVNARVTVEIQP